MCVWVNVCEESEIHFFTQNRWVFFKKFRLTIVPVEVPSKFVPFTPYYPQYLYYGRANFWAENSTNDTLSLKNDAESRYGACENYTQLSILRVLEL